MRTRTETKEGTTPQQRAIDALIVYRELTAPRNYGRSKRCKGAE